MAKTKYKVQQGDNWAKLGNPQQLMALNPGVPKLSQGQTIFLPSNTSQTPYGPPKPPGYGGQVYGPPKPPIFTTAAMLPQPQLPQNLYGPPQAAPNTGPGFNQNINYTPVQGPPKPPGYNPPQAGYNQAVNYANSSTPITTQAPATPTTTTLPANYVYQGGMSPEAIEQRRRWNIAAGGDPAVFNDPNNRVFITTRAQVKAMKEAQWRRQGRGQGNNTRAATSAVSPIAPVEEQILQGNAVSANTSWRVG